MIKKLSKQHQKDIAAIGGTTSDRISMLVEAYHNNVISPYKNWDRVLKKLDVKVESKVLDLACGNGRTAIDISKKFHNRVTGVDVVEKYINFAQEYAKKEKVGNLCKFYNLDARTAIKKFRNFDYIFWLSAPHLWGGADKIIRSLRQCTKSGGFVIVYDAYYLSNREKRHDSWYSLKRTTEKLENFGDKVIQVYDEKNSGWKDSYNEDRKIYTSYQKTVKDQKIVKQIKRQLRTLDRMEKWETKNFGTAFWIVKIK